VCEPFRKPKENP
jgi:hypothetical protein